MRRKRERTRIARREGWARGNSQQDPVVIYDPETEIDLCVAYDQGWSEGASAPRGADNPYGITEENRVPRTHWHQAPGQIPHFFIKGTSRSACGMVYFTSRHSQIDHPSDPCQACRR